MAAKAPRKRNPAVIEAVFVLVVLALIAGGGVVGWVVGKESKSTATAAPAAAPVGHTGQGLASRAFGDSAKGKALFASKRCIDCHSYNGQGGTDAPALDYMRGHLSAREIAGMSGDIWNHVPMMIDHFKDENIPFPTFTEAEMADLIAFLHSVAKSSAG